MNKPITLKCTFENRLRIDQVIQISQLAKSYSGSIYLVTKNKNVINTENFPTFFTYLLTKKNGQEISLIINGPYPHLKLNDLNSIVSSKTRSMKKPMVQAIVKAKI